METKPKDLKEELKGKRIRLEDPFTPTSIGGYHLLRLLGKGSFGKVYMATDKLGKVFAVKEINYVTETKILKRIQNEIEILKVLDHPNIIKLHDVIKDSESKIYLITEYCAGGDLVQYLKRKKVLGELEVQRIVHQVGAGLEELYKKKIMHRDIKLQNLLLANDKDELHIKIADFGLARYTTSYASTICGTLHYMAPEILRG